jgi:Fe-Mn family superoxide dismutase
MVLRSTDVTAGIPFLEYAEGDFSALRGLKVIPDSLVEAHLKLYSGYVKNTNLLREKLAATKPGSLEWSEMQRRMGFELNGLRLHELYFENLCPGGTALSRGTSELLGESWKNSAAWEEEFRAVAAMRGVGWATLYRDPRTGGLSNHWITLHQEGHPAGFTPILVMDLWEHAFSGMERARYIDAFFDNLNWTQVDARLENNPSPDSENARSRASSARAVKQ